jgi:hypothetical protein
LPPVYIFAQSTGTQYGFLTKHRGLRWVEKDVPRYNSFAREAAATLLRMAKTTKDPQVASGLVQRAADLKDRTGELPPVDDIGAIAEQSKKPLTKN